MMLCHPVDNPWIKRDTKRKKKQIKEEHCIQQNNKDNRVDTSSDENGHTINGDKNLIETASMARKTFVSLTMQTCVVET